ncbi:unnamed protein product [Phaeothamnion confervicola]
MKEGSRAKLTIGFETNCIPDLNQLLDDARQQHFDFVAAPLVHPRLRRDARGLSDAREAPLTRSDTLLDSRSWGSLVVGKVSEWIELDAPGAEARKAAEQAFKQEMAWASHLSMAAVVVPPPDGKMCANYARCLNQVVQELTYVQVWMRIPMAYPQADEPSTAAGVGTSDGTIAAAGSQPQPPLLPPPPGIPVPAVIPAATLDLTATGSGPASADPGAAAAAAAADVLKAPPSPPPLDPWEAWNRIRVMCEHRGGLSVALELTADLPGPREVDRWTGEPVRVLIVPTSVFITNRKGFPTLSKAHQAVVTAFIGQKVQMMLKGRPRHSEGYLPYLQYLEHLNERRPPPP